MEMIHLGQSKVLIPGMERFLENAMATQSSILSWIIPGTDKSGEAIVHLMNIHTEKRNVLDSMGLIRK